MRNRNNKGQFLKSNKYKVLKNIVKIYLKHGVTIIDRNDYELVNQYSWYIQYVRKNTLTTKEYVRVVGIKDNKKIKLHRLIMNAKSGEIVDHINRNTLDNRKQNLRITSDNINRRNRIARKTSSSPFKGVWKSTSRKNKWTAQIFLEGKTKHLGYFDTKEQARDAYLKAEKEYFGFNHV